MFPLLKCLRMDDISNYFPATNALYCRILHIQSQHISGDDSSDPAEAPMVLGPRHLFPLESPAFLLFRFYKTASDPKSLSSSSLFVYQKMLLAQRDIAKQRKIYESLGQFGKNTFDLMF